MCQTGRINQLILKYVSVTILVESVQKLNYCGQNVKKQQRVVAPLCNAPVVSVGGGSEIAERQ